MKRLIEFLLVLLWTMLSLSAYGNQDSSVEALQNMVAKHLLSQFALAHKPAVFLLSDSEVILPLDINKLSISQTLPERLSARMFVSFEHSDKKTPEFSAWFSVGYHSELLVLEKNVHLGEILLADQFQLLRKDRLRLGCKAINKSYLNGAYRYVRSYKAKKAICIKDIELVPDVEKGSQITVLYQQQAVSMAMAANTLQSALIGEQLKVKLHMNGKSLEVRLINPKEAIYEI